MIDTAQEAAAALDHEPPTLAELERMAEDVLDRRSARYVEACFHFARFIRDHGRDGHRLAEAIQAGKVEEALVMCKGISR